jgi:choline dehydrogenase
VGEVKLRAPDFNMDPVIRANYLSDPGGEDLKAVTWGLKLCRKIAAAKAFDRYRGDEIMPGAQVQDEEGWAAHVRAEGTTIYHPVGTCKMGSDRMAVVDDELRVHGVKNLRVVDASIMPLIVRGNTNAPVIMVAEKAADLIRGQ